MLCSVHTSYNHKMCFDRRKTSKGFGFSGYNCSLSFIKNGCTLYSVHSVVNLQVFWCYFVFILFRSMSPFPTDFTQSKIIAKKFRLDPHLHIHMPKIGSVLFFISSFFIRSFFIRSFFIRSFFIRFVFYTVHFL